MRRVHVGLDLEHEAGELFLVRRHLASQGLSRGRRRRHVHQGVKQFPHAEIVDGRAEIHRRQAAGQEGLLVKFMAGAAHQFHLFAQLRGHGTEQFVQAWIVQAFDHLAFLNLASVGRAV